MFLEGNFAPVNEELFDQGLKVRQLPWIARVTNTAVGTALLLHMMHPLIARSNAPVHDQHAVVLGGDCHMSRLVLSSAAELQTHCGTTIQLMPLFRQGCRPPLAWPPSVSHSLPRYRPLPSHNHHASTCCPSPNSPKVLEGVIPPELSGAFMRVGPNPALPPVGGYHW